jgi:hypothetical protein
MRRRALRFKRLAREYARDASILVGDATLAAQGTVMDPDRTPV